MAKNVQLKYAVQAYLLLTWSAFAYAAESPFIAGIESIPARAFVYVLGLAVIGGAAGTLTKLSRPDTVVRNLPLEICRDILASVVAGMLVFFFTSSVKWFDFWLMAALVTLAGYGGSKVLDLLLVDGALPALKNLIQRIFNITPNPPKE